LLGRIINKPEMTLEGNIARRGRCEYTFIMTQGTMILLIQLKQNLTALHDATYSEIVAQVLVEADGAHCFRHF
jgi:hypothetical protein